MQAQSLCAQVAATLGESGWLIKFRGFQPDRRRTPLAGPRLFALNCPFCGQQVLLARPTDDAFEVECLSCGTAFEAAASDVYRVTVAAAEKPHPRRFTVDL